MSEPSRATTVLRVPAAFYLIIPLLCGPLMLLGGILVTLGVPESRGTRILVLLAGFGRTEMGIRGTRQRTVLIEGLNSKAMTDHGASRSLEFFAGNP